MPDTDWHLDRNYAFAAALDATVISAKVSRYVTDLNRAAAGEWLYPGMTTTSLCPLETFRGQEIYREGRAPDEKEVERRIATHWRPYHFALQDELARLRAQQAHVLLWKAHSIASLLPRLFQGKLPDFKFGTADGASCTGDVVKGAIDPMRESQVSWVLNGRFKGGFITRRYGAPVGGIHAIQLEMSHSLYPEESAQFWWRPDLADKAMPVVQACVQGSLTALVRLPSAA